jgi:tetratricopeptide (TPR) repeat protein
MRGREAVGDAQVPTAVKRAPTLKSSPRKHKEGSPKPPLVATPSRRAAEQMGRRIRQARQEMGISLSALAGKDFSRSFLNQVELGRARPSVRNLQIIAERLNRPVEYFLQDHELSATAIELALTEAETCLRRGDGPGAQHLIARLAERPHLPLEIRVRVDVIQAEAFIRQGAADEAIPILQRAIAIGEARRWYGSLVELYDRMGSAHYLLRRPVEAARWYEKAFATYESGAVSDPLLKARVLGHRANVHYVSGHPQEAIVAYQAAIGTAEGVVDMQGLAGMYEGLAMSFHKAGHPDRALTYAQRSLRLYETLQDIRMSAQLRNNMACILLEQGDAVQAEALFVAGAQQLRGVGDTELLPHLLAGAAEAALERGDLTKAASRLTVALKAAASSNDPIALLTVERIGGRLAHSTGDISEARQHFERALEIADHANSATDRTRVAYDYAKILEANGDHQEAARRYREAFESRKGSANR